MSQLHTWVDSLVVSVVGSNFLFRFGFDWNDDQYVSTGRRVSLAPANRDAPSKNSFEMPPARRQAISPHSAAPASLYPGFWSHRRGCLLAAVQATGYPRETAVFARPDDGHGNAVITVDWG